MMSRRTVDAVAIEGGKVKVMAHGASLVAIDTALHCDPIGLTKGLFLNHKTVMYGSGA